MSKSAESVMVRASVSALEYHEAAWKAHELHSTPPDPLFLSDRALQAVVQYETQDLPVEAFEAVEGEVRRRGLAPIFVDRVLGWAVVALLGISGVVIGWALLAH